MENIKPYKLGLVVKLKSGGPDMTVTELNVSPTHRGNLNEHSSWDWTNSYTCSWFSGEELKFGSFPHDSLVVELSLIHI